MTDLWEYLKTVTNPIYLYGTGNGADKIIDTLDTLNVKVSGVFVSDGFVRDKTFRGFKITDYNTAKSRDPDMIVLVAFGTQLADVLQNIRKIASECELYAPELPVIGNGLFNAEYYTRNIHRITRIRDLLSDDLSVKTFDNIINCKLSGKTEYLTACETTPDEVYSNIIKPGGADVFVDLGAYRGDTVKEYMEKAGGYKKIYAVEPDAKTFSKLRTAVAQYDNVLLYNLAVSDKKGESLFDMQSGRSSRLDKTGTVVKTDTVDNILNGERADYIKFDVEGAEKQAINGAYNTITKYKPTLCVSAYHRAYDLVDIAEQVLSIRPDYKVFLRHFPYIPAWDTNYYFV